MSRASEAWGITILILLLPVIILVFIGGWLKQDVFGERKRKSR